MKANARYILATFTVLFFGFVGYVQLAAAIPMTWNLVGVEFDDSAFATGYFQYDASTNAMGAYSISTTDGVIGGHTYTPGSSWAITALDRFQLYVGGEQIMMLLFADDGLTDTGGTVSLRNTSFEMARNSPPVTRYVAAGHVTSSSSVPDASVMFLLGTSLLFLGLLGRRKQRN